MIGPLEKGTMHSEDGVRAGDGACRVSIECTHLYQHGLNTGIQRVVRNLVRQGEACAAELGLEVQPVILTRGGFARVDSQKLLPRKKGFFGRVWMAGRRVFFRMSSAGSGGKKAGGGEAEGSKRSLSLKGTIIRLAYGLVGLWENLLQRWRSVRLAGGRVHAGPSDLLILADVSWKSELLWEHVQAWRKQGGRVAIICYDLIPIQTPEFVSELASRSFRRYMTNAAQMVDFTIGISKHSAQEFFEFARSIDQPGWTAERCGSFRLGADEWAKGKVGPSEDAKATLASLKGKPYFVAVGTVEIRKNHRAMLDAFDRLWAEGVDAALVIIGNYGWRSPEIAERIHASPEFGKRLFWFTGAPDADLEMWYEQCRAVLMSSKAEGFGLPVVEALVRGKQVIASSIPTHVEIADGYVTFFEPDDVAALVAAIRRNLAGEKKEIAGYRWPGWRESAKEFLTECHRMLALGPRA